MLRSLFPDLYVESVLQLPLDKLFNYGIRAFLFDLDNTVTEWNSNIIHEEIIYWFAQAKEKGFKACLVSNNGRERVLKVAENLGIPFVSRAGKPRRKAFRQAMDIIGCGPEETAVIGDQVFTDILGGNRMSLFTILVVPITRKEFFGTRITRQIEKLVLLQIGPTATPEKLDGFFGE
ncbi:MAG: YqeG family HAD IIIA-type phosphatase [Chitinophagales bacterium]